MLKNRNYIISGSSKGIGLSIAEEILKNSGNVLLTGRNRKQLIRTKNKLKKIYRNSTILYCQGDVGNKKTLNMIHSIFKKNKWKKLNGIIANSGSTKPNTNLFNEKDFHWFLKNNFLNSYNFINFFIKKFSHTLDSIVFISSIAANKPGIAPFHYTSSKAMLNLYANELVRKYSNRFRINVVSPGNILFKNGNWEKKIKKNKSKISKMIREKVPLKRFGLPDEISKMVVFLLSDKASFITGTNVKVDGGQSIK